MHRGSWVVALALGLGALAGCGDTVTEPAGRVEYFPAAVGNRWTYAPEDPWLGQSFRWQVTERRGDTVRVARPPLGSHPGPVTLVRRADGIDLLVDGGLAPHYRFTRGAWWVHRDPWECDDGAAFAVAPATESVVTPAGTFPDCIRIERRSAARCTDAGTMVEWWAPGVGLVRWDELNFYAGGPLRFELISYTVD